MRVVRWTVVLCAVLGLAACNRGGGGVDAKRIEAAAANDWLSYGRTYDEQRYSPLDQVNKDTVSRLGVAWWASSLAMCRARVTSRAMMAAPVITPEALRSGPIEMSSVCRS